MLRQDDPARLVPRLARENRVKVQGIGAAYNAGLADLELPVELNHVDVANFI